MKHLALIGMMGCGKSTLAQDLAEKTGRPLFVCDQEIEKAAGMSIPQIFTREGEMAFRAWEGKCALRLASQKGMIVDCGGGFITQKANTALLKKSSVLVFISRPIEEILKTLDASARPLAGDAEAFQKLYQKRLPLYLEAADYQIDNTHLAQGLLELQRIAEDLK